MKSFYPTLLLWSLLLVAGCNDTGFVDEISTGTQQTITLSVSMPDNGDTDTRVASGQMLNSNKIVLKWKEGDEIQLYFKLDDIILTGEKVKVQNISVDGKKADFTVTLPQNVTGSFDLYGVHGTSSENVNGAIFLDVTPDKFVKLEDARVPLYFKMEDLTPESEGIVVAFKHFGTLQVITLKNTVNKLMTVGNPSLVFNEGKWYYDAQGGNVPVYDIVTGVTSMVEGKSTTPESSTPVEIGYNDNVKLAQWVMPNEVKPPAIQLKAEIDGKVKTSNAKGARSNALIKGSACHLYVTWNGSNLTFKEEEADVQTYKITMTTSRDVGAKIRLHINADVADQGDVWIDLDNNGVRETSEMVKKFGGSTFYNYTIGSQTVTLYGKVTELTCNENDLTALDISGGSALTILSCYKNDLTALDVSGATALTLLYCYDNKLAALNVSGAKALKSMYCYNNNLTELDVKDNNAITILHCYNNKITALDLSHKSSLQYLYCHTNSLTSLGVINTNSLIGLHCYTNSLTKLTLYNSPDLSYLVCFNNNISGTDMDNLMNGLPTRTVNYEGRLYIINTEGDGNVCTKSHVRVANYKHWYVYDSDKVKYSGS